MDKKHWWFATKLQESFQIGGYDSPTLLEDFLTDTRTSDLIDSLLSSGGLRKLFFFCKEASGEHLSSRELYVTDEPSQDASIDSYPCLYFLRLDNSYAVDVARIEEEIYCGEVKGSVRSTIELLMSEVFSPLLKAQDKSSWGQCTASEVEEFLSSLDKIGEALATDFTSSTVTMLRPPRPAMVQELKQQQKQQLHSKVPIDPGVLLEVKGLVGEWMLAIEGVMLEGAEDRSWDKKSGPMTEVRHWKRRQHIIDSILDQLNSKQGRAVIGCLLASKSKVLKQWKATDASITEATNEAKDKVAYLKAVGRHFEPLYSDTATPFSVANTVLPAMCQTIKHLDGMSQKYAENGFLGLILSKVCFQLVTVCTKFITSFCTSPSKDYFWQQVRDEVKGQTAKSSTEQEGGCAPDPQAGGLVWCLEGCRALHNSFKEMIENVKDSLSYAFSRQQAPVSGMSRRSHASRHSIVSSVCELAATPSTGARNGPLKFLDINDIMAYFNLFGDRVHRIITVIRVLREYQQLSHALVGAPGIPHKMSGLENPLIGSTAEKVVDMNDPEPVPEPPVSRSTRVRSVEVMTTVQEEGEDEQLEEVFKVDIKQKLDSISDDTHIGNGIDDNNIGGGDGGDGGDADDVDDNDDDDDLGIRDVDDSSEDEDSGTGGRSESSDITLVSVESNNSLDGDQQKINELTDTWLGHALSTQMVGGAIALPETSVSAALDKAIDAILEVLVAMLPSTDVLLSIAGKHLNVFPAACDVFARNIEQLEQNMRSYIKVTCDRNISTEMMLDFLGRFNCMSHCACYEQLLAEKYLEAFTEYRSDLAEIQALYEQFKDSPPSAEHMPPVANAIAWSRNLLHRIEDPIQIFKDNKSVTQSLNYGPTVKLYNRVASALVAFESLWFNQWLSRVENARSGLKAFLLTYQSSNRELRVNADNRVVTLIAEGVTLQRLGLSLPENVVSVLGMEKQIKTYRMFLEQLLVEYRAVFLKVPPTICSLLSSHSELLLRHMRPGWTALTWDSINIDAYLHRVRSAIANVHKVVNSMSRIAESVDQQIASIETTSLYGSEIVTSRVLDCQLFDSVMAEVIKSQSDKIWALLHSIEESVKELISLADSSAAELTGTAPRPLSASSKHPKVVVKRARSFSPHRRAKSKGIKKLSPILSRRGEPLESVRLPPLPLRQMEQTELPKPLPLPSQKYVEPIDRAQYSIETSVNNLNQSDVTNVLSNYALCISEAMRHCTLESLSELLAVMASKELNNDQSGVRVQFSTSLHYKYPDIVLESSIKSIQLVVNHVVQMTLDVSHALVWLGKPLPDKAPALHTADVQDSTIAGVCQSLETCISGICDKVESQLALFKQYDFLWSSEMKKTYQAVLRDNPDVAISTKHVKSLLVLEKEIKSVDSAINVGPLHLQTDPVKNTLIALAVYWKTKYAELIHKEAKLKMDAIVNSCEKIHERLCRKVESLPDLWNVLQEVQDVLSTDSTNDWLYQPIEDTYRLLREFNVFLPRDEVNQVASLRSTWQNLVTIARQVEERLLVEQRRPFERELDKQVKEFMVTIIQFRNKFDVEGPVVPGLMPREAVDRLTTFQKEYDRHVETREMLDAVQKLLEVPITLYPELDQLEEELELLGLLYGLYQKVLDFDKKFTSTLWSEAKIQESFDDMYECWTECLKMPRRLQSWSAYGEMRNKIRKYLNVFPLLLRLSAKEIRNRHWLSVLEVTGKPFQFESLCFKLSHLLECDLVEHKEAINEICDSAVAEEQLELKMKLIEEEWSEQALVFSKYKNVGNVALSIRETQQLLEQLEDVECTLAIMLASCHINPMKGTAEAWSRRLNQVSCILEKWLAVQEVWSHLEAVFSQASVAQSMPQEFKQFQQIDKNWTKMMRHSYETRNVLECCLGGDIPKGVLLDSLAAGLELCRQSLGGYLDAKRNVFPRLYLIPDSMLLAVLSQHESVDSLVPHLKLMFSNVSQLKLKQPSGKNTSCIEDSSKTKSRQRGSKALSQTSLHDSEDTNVSEQQSVITAIESSEGESLDLLSPVTLSHNVEEWLLDLSKQIFVTVSALIEQAVREVQALQLDDVCYRNCAQACQLAVRYLWTRDCEKAICSSRYDRKAVMNLCQHIAIILNRLPGLLIRGKWRNAEQGVLTRQQRLKVQSVLVSGLHLRDCLEELLKRKLRDLADFDWRKHCRFYVKRDEDLSVPPKLEMSLLDSTVPYGCEYQGLSHHLVPTPMTDRAFVALSQSAQHHRTAVLSGEHGVGKTETVKALAQLFGKFMILVNCTSLLLPSAFSSLLHGVTQDGAWCCLDDLHTLSSKSLSVAVQLLRTVYLGLQSTADAILFNGKRITIAKSFAVFATASVSSGTPYLVPSHSRLVFRTVSLPEPDTTAIVKAWLTNEGFRSPRMLADRIVVMASLCKDQLPSQPQANFSLGSLYVAIKLASDRKPAPGVLRASTCGSLESGLEGRSYRSNSLSSVGGLTVGTAGGKERLFLAGTVATSVGAAAKAQAMAAVRKAHSLTSLTDNAKIDHALVGGALKQVLGARMSTQDSMVFHNILRDVWNFCSLQDIDSSTEAEQEKLSLIQAACTNQASQLGLVAHPPWMHKLMQLYTLLKYSPGVIVAGTCGSGKTSCIKTLASGLTMYSAGQASSHTNNLAILYKTHFINPVAALSLSDIFGHIDSSGNWQEGIFTLLLKRAMKSQNVVSWFCFDGPVTADWTDCLTHVLDGNQMLTLTDGTRLMLTENVKVILETTDLKKASPSVLSKTSILYLDDGILGWEPLFEAWLATRPSKERQDLGDLMTATIDQVIHFVKNNCSPLLMVCEAGIFQTCLSLLSTLLNNYAETGEVFEKMHVERLFLFSVVWSFGSLLQGPDRIHFSDFIKTLTKCFPDDFGGLGPLTVFDFYVDESGEFDPWHMRLPDRNYVEAGDMLGEVYVETPTMVCIALLMDLASAANRNILLVGPSGAGKTTAINQFLSKPDHKSKIVKRLAFCPCTTANSLCDFFDANMYHRQGFTYGPHNGKSMELFIDDLNLCVTDAFCNQSANEFLRQVLDYHGYFCKCTHRIGQMKEVADITVMASVRTVVHITTPQLPERLRRHFAIFCLPEPSRDSIQTMASSVLEACMTQNNGVGLPIDLHERVVKASCDVLFLIQQNLQPCELPGREHYCFTQKELTKVFQGLQHCNEEMCSYRNSLVAVWQHEMSRVFLDRVCRSADHKWIEETIQIVSAKHFPRVDNTKKHQIFVTFPLDVQSFQHRRSAMSHSGSKCTLLSMPLNDNLIIHTSIGDYRDRYCEESDTDSLKLTLSELTVVHIVRLHRIMTFYRGDVLMIGRFGMDLQALAKLALYMSGFEALPTPVASSQTTAFFDLLRNSFRQAGLEGKGCSLVLTELDLEDHVIMEAVNAFVVTGEVPLLFTDDELQGLLQSLIPTIQKDFPSCDTDPMEYFTARVRRCLRLVLCLRPDHPSITSQAHLYHGLISGLNVVWVKDWPQRTVANDADVMLKDVPAVLNLDANTRKCLIECIAAIHCQALRDGNHLPWMDSVVDQKSESAPESQSLSTNKPKRVYRTVTLSPSIVLLERIKHMEHQRTSTHKQRPFIGPKMFERFVECFRRVFTGKSRQSSKVLSQLRSALSTLDQVALHAENLRKTIKELNSEHTTASSVSSSLLTDLTNAACAVEKLKARLGKGSYFITAFSYANELHLQELIDTEEELEEDLLGAYVEGYDHQRERLLDAIQEIERNQIPLGKQLSDCQEQVIYWRNKMDRNTVERIRSLNSPPRLIGTIMELVMTLIRHTQEHSMEADTAAADAGSDLTASSPMPPSSHTPSSTKKLYSLSVLPGGTMQSKLDRDQWTAIQLQIGDPQKFVEAVQQVPWEEGLAPDLAGLIEAYLSSTPVSDYGASVTSEALKPKSVSQRGSRAGSSLEQGTSMTSESQKPKLRRGSSKVGFSVTKQMKTSEASSGITLAAAKHASEDTAVLMAYVIAILDYHRCYVPHKSNELKLVDLHKEMNKMEEDLQKKKQTAEIQNEKVEQKTEEQETSLSEEDLPRLEQEMTDLQTQFEEAVQVKYNIEQQRTKAKEMLKYGETALERLANLRTNWAAQLADIEGDPGLVTNCLAAAAFVTYCLPLEPCARMTLAASFVNTAQRHGLPVPSKKLFHDLSVVPFLTEMQPGSCFDRDREPECNPEWNLADEVSMQNAHLMMKQCIINQWIVIVDRQRFALSWIRNAKKEIKLVKYGSPSVRKMLEQCLTSGSPLLLFDIEPEVLLTDTMLYTILRNTDKFDKPSKSFKIAVGDQEVECAPGFKLFLLTTVPLKKLTTEFLSSFVVVQFVPTFDGIETMLCNRYVRLEKPVLHEAKRMGSEEINAVVSELESLERKLLTSLIAKQGQSILDNVTETELLTSGAKEFDQAQESLFMALDHQNSLYSQQLDASKDVAHRGAVLFGVAQCMASMNSLYQITWENFLVLFDEAIQGTDKTVHKSTVDRLTRLVLCHLSQGVKEEDRLFLEVILAIETEQAAGRCSLFEKKFLLSPQSIASDVYSSLVNVGTVPSGVPIPNVKVFGKKPFDWMTEDQWHNIQILGFMFDWFSEAVERISKEGRENVWKHICEHDMSQSVALPENLDDRISPVQKLICLRTIRPEKFIEIVTFFVDSVLGHRMTKNMPSALTDVPLNIAPKIPALLLYEQEPAIVSRTVLELANKCHTSVESIVLSGVPGEEQDTLLLVQKAMTNGCWVLMEHVQVCPNLLKSLSNLLSETVVVNESFRLWISAEPSSPLPPGILLDSARFFLDTPLDMKSAVTRSLSWIPKELLRWSPRQEWPTLLHNICVLHSALRFRTNIKGIGFNANYTWDVQNLWDALGYAREEFTLADKVDPSWGTSSPKGVSWIGLRKVLTQIVYGSQVTDFPDYQAVKSMVDQWISQQALKKEFVAPKTKYKLSSSAFALPLKVTNIVNAVRCSNVSSLPEMCGLLTTPETQSTEDQHIMSCLNIAFELLAAVSPPILTPNTTLTSLTLPVGAGVALPKGKRPGTPVGGTRKMAIIHRGVAKSSAERSGPSVAHLSHAAYLKPSKDVDFPELIGSLVLKVYKGWSKENVSERLKRLGANLPFSLWIKEEVEQMQKILDEFRSALLVRLTAIRSALEPDSKPTVLSPAALSIACDLFHNRIPDIIYHLSTSSLPPQSEVAMANWISDLTQRCQHMDRVLTLGHEKIPLFWLGAFFHPEGLLSTYKQNSFQSHEAKFSITEQFSYSVEATTRDKELVRDPPTEGLFVYGIHMWGATWDRTSNEVTDVAPKLGPQPLPIVHVTAISQTEKMALMDLGKCASVYSSPCYLSKSSKGSILMNIDVKRDDIPALRWPLRGVICSLRPF